jgi:hypothetical protein
MKKKLQEQREKAIIESFAKTFNKIKRLDEDEIQLNEYTPIDNLKQKNKIIKPIDFLKENTNADVVTNYTTEKESDKAAMVVMPYVTTAGSEKSLKMWVPKSVLDKNNGIPKWAIKQYLEDLNKKGIKYDAVNILKTIGKSASDVAASQPAKPEYVEIYDFIVNTQALVDLTQRDKKDFRDSTRYIKQTNTIVDMGKAKSIITTNTKEKAQERINQMITNWKIDKLPLIVYKTKVSKETADKMIGLNPFNFENVSTKEVKEKDIQKYF